MAFVMWSRIGPSTGGGNSAPSARLRRELADRGAGTLLDGRHDDREEMAFVIWSRIAPSTGPLKPSSTCGAGNTGSQQAATPSVPAEQRAVPAEQRAAAFAC